MKNLQEAVGMDARRPSLVPLRNCLLSDWRLAFLGVVALSAVLRLYQLGTESLWIDEGCSLRDTTAYANPLKDSKPLYYWILTLWVKLGDADWFLRLPAVLFGIASVVLIFLIGRMIWNARVGTMAGLMAAVSPMQVNHSQEVRMYSLMLLCGLASSYFLLLSLRKWQFRYMLGCAFFMWLGALTQPFTIFLVLAQNLTMLDAYLHDRKRNLLPWILSQTLLVLAWMPWILMIINPEYFAHSSFFAGLKANPVVSDIPALWTTLGIGDWDPRFANKALLVYMYGATAAILLGCWMERKKIEARYVAAWLLVPALALLVISNVRANIWVPRFLIYIAPAFFLLLAVFWARQKNKLIIAALGVLFVLVPTGKLVRYYQATTRPEWKKAIHFMTQRDRHGDVVGVFRRGSYWVFDHYYKGPAQYTPLGSTEFDVREVVNDWNEAKALEVIKSMPKANRKWLILTQVAPEAYRAMDAALRSHYRVIDSRRLYGIGIYLYVDR